MKTETLPTKMVHDEVDWTEKQLRTFITSHKGSEKEKHTIRFLVAKLKFLTWATLVQGPEVPEGQMTIHWPDMDWFVDQAERWDARQLSQEITELMPRYLQYLQTVPNFTRAPGPEVWRRFALDW